MTRQQVINGLWNDIHLSVSAMVDTRKKADRESLFSQILTFSDELKQEYTAKAKDVERLYTKQMDTRSITDKVCDMVNVEKRRRVEI